MARRNRRDVTQDPLYRLAYDMMKGMPGASERVNPRDPRAGLRPLQAPAAPASTGPGTPAPSAPSSTAPPPIDGTPPPANLSDDPEDPSDDADTLATAPFDIQAEAVVVMRAIKLACDTRSRASRLTEMLDGTAMTPTISRGATDTFRRNHSVALAELTIRDHEIMFGDPPEGYREAFAGYCYTMYRGYGARFIDRNPAETDEEFIDRPGRLSTNLTKLIIKILSKLYAKPPERTPKEGTDPEVAKALALMWADPLYNLTLLEADKMTRLLGVVAIRPFWDPERAGGIRIWPFLAHQIRILPDLGSPWKPAAVIERVQPFRTEDTRVVWTDKFYIEWVDGIPREPADFVRFERHGLGRVPHTVIMDEPSYTSVYVDGIGRTLCPRHASINERLTDLHEIEKLQGFAVAEVLNPEASKPRISPRTAWVFRPQGGANAKPYGINFKNPGAPIESLRASIEADVRDVLRDHGIPEAALGAAIQQRQLSGAAIRAAMQPLDDDRDQRARVWGERETDLSDSCLRMKREHDGSFAYDHTTRPEFTTRYQKPEIPMDTSEKVKSDEAAVAMGTKSPPDIMMRDDPELYATREKAAEKWKANIAEMKAAGLAVGDEPDPNPIGGKPGGASTDLVESGNAMVDALLLEMDSGPEETEARMRGRREESNRRAADLAGGRLNGKPAR